MEHELKTAVGGEETLKKSTQKEVKGVVQVKAIAPRRSWAELAWEVMHNELVVSQIARKMPSRSLLNLRETCSLWNTKFIPEVQTKHDPLVLNWSEDDPWSPERVRGAFDFTKVFKSSSKVPFTRFQCSGSNGFDRLVRYKLYKFIETFGNSITMLHLDWRIEDLPIKQLRRIIFELTPVLSELSLEPYFPYGDHFNSPSKHEANPNLRGLTKILPKLRRLRVLDQMDHVSPKFTQLVSDTILCASGLQLLELRDRDIRERNFVRTNLAALLKNPTQIHKLKALVLGHFETADNLRILIKLARQNRNSLHLRTFRADLGCKWRPGSEEDRGTITLFQTFLETQSPTLEDLKLTLQGELSTNTRERVPFRIPQMPHLTQIRISNWALPREEIMFGETDSFVETFPKLRQFSCNFNDDLDRLHHPMVGDLKLEIGIAHLTRFGSIFPSLTRLELKMTSKNDEDIENYASVWTVWPNLTVIHLTGTITCSDMDFDSFLTGVPRLKIKAMMQELTSSVQSQASTSAILETVHSLLDKYKTEPGIRDLKQLRELKLDTHGEKMPKYRWHRLTDIGGYFGVGLASPCLKRVLINGRAKNLVSEKCHVFIRNIFGLGLEIMF